MRLVLDTDVIVAAMRSPGGASAALLRRIDDGHAVMLVSLALILEYEAVCQRADHLLASGLTRAEVTSVIDGLVLLAEEVTPYFRWRPQLRDAGDEMVLEAAVNGRAHAIVTFNAREYGTAPARFGIELLRPGPALRRMAS